LLTSQPRITIYALIAVLLLAAIVVASTAAILFVRRDEPTTRLIDLINALSRSERTPPDD
jgi:hypothetical protein